MRPFLLAIFGLAVLIPNLSCSVNALEGFSDKYSNDALFVDAKMQINKGNFDSALSKISDMSPDFQARREVRMLAASAYGGKCGINFLEVVTGLTDLGTTRLFPFLLDQFRGGSPATIDACLAAENIIESIGAVGARNTDENLFLAIVSLAKMGKVLSYYLDADQDGTTETFGTVDPCLRARGARTGGPFDGDFFPADLREFGSGLTLFLQNISALAGQIDLGSGSVTDVTAACADLAGINPSYDFCSVTDPAAFTADHLQALVTLLNEDSVLGLGSNCTGDVTACVCP
jgi:hypothetical protein